MAPDIISMVDMANVGAVVMNFLLRVVNVAASAALSMPVMIAQP